MLRYTARNGTTFHFALLPLPHPTGAFESTAAAIDTVQVITTDHDGPPFELDLSDVREFLQHLEDRSAESGDEPTDADLAAVGPD